MQPIDEHNVEPGQKVQYGPEKGSRVFDTSVEREDKLHKHHPDDKAHLFSSGGQGQTEDEYLNLLSAVVRCCKPERAVETGTYLADGSLAILNAMHANGFGHLDTVESSRTNWDKGEARLKREAPKGRATWSHHHVPARKFFGVGWDRFRPCRPEIIAEVDDGARYQLAFLDCNLATRHIELDILMSRKLLSPGAFVLIHDTNPLRLQRPRKAEAYRAGMAEVLPKWGITELVEFSLSRGMTILRVAEH